jgi:adenosylcobinamide-GDP ribazoletransferase
MDLRRSRLNSDAARIGAGLAIWAADLGAALAFSTRLPIGSAGPALPAALRTLPLAGALIGAGTAAVLAALVGLGLAPLAAAAAALAAQLVLTGALHEDGLADVADGFGGGADRAAKLAIMRDSRIGTYGAAALALSLIGRAALMAQIAAGTGWPATLALLAAAGALSRGGVVWVLSALPPARDEGLGHGAGRPPAGTLGQAAAAAGLLGLLLVWPSAGPVALVAAMILALAASWGVIEIARRQIGGQTGDVCGAAQQGSEIAALAALAASV